MIKRAGFNFIFVGIILSVFLLAGFVSAVNYVSVGTGNNQKYWSTSDIDSNPTSGSINCSFADSFLNDPVYFQNHSNRDLLVF